MTIPNLDRAIIDPRKLSEYLLNLGHPRGGPKAKFFLAQGFSGDSLTAALTMHAAGAEAIVRTTPFSVIYVVEGPLALPSGRSRQVRAVWEIRNDETVLRLVTAYPVE